MEANHKKILKAIVLELRHTLEGYYNGSDWHGGDLEQRLNALGVWRDRNPLPADELAGMSAADREARKVVDAYLKLRDEAGVARDEAVAEFVRETAYTWSNRLLALRCMESRDLIDEVILQKDVYGGRSLEHNRLAQRSPELCAGDDDGLFATLDKAFVKQAEHLPLLFDPDAPGVALKPGVAALRRAIALLSGTEAVRGQEVATSDVFRAPDAFGWAYQYWNTEEKGRVFEKVRTHKGSKIEGADIIPATQLYTEPYMVKFLVQNSLGATWTGMNPDTSLPAGWEYYVRGADRTAVEKKPVREITFLDPACGSGHFLLEAFDLFYSMYEEEGEISEAESICRSILEHNLYGIDIDERAVQISEAALWMKAAEKLLQVGSSTSFTAVSANLVATNIRLPKGVDHLKAFLERYPDDKDLSPALEIVFTGLESADELGSLLQIEKPVDAKLKQLQEQQEQLKRSGGVQSHLYQPTLVQGELPVGLASFSEWKTEALNRIEKHFSESATAHDVVEAFFSRSAVRAVELLSLLSRRYDVVAANPPYMGAGNMGSTARRYIETHFAPGKRDLFSAFILRCLEFCAASGRVAMVTQHSWMFLRSFERLRSGDGNDEKGLLQQYSIETIAHLGPGGFAEISGEVVSSVLFTIGKYPPPENHPVAAFRLLRANSPNEKARLLLEAISNDGHAAAFKPIQISFLFVPSSAMSYWLPQSILTLFKTRPSVSSLGFMSWGVSSSNNDRFLRFWWETLYSRRWKKHAKGGSYGRWAGYVDHTVDWATDGTKLKEFIVERYPYLGRNYEIKIRPYTLNHHGWTYSSMGRSSIGARLLQPDQTTNAKSPALFLDEERLDIGCILNARIASYVVRAITPNVNIDEGYVGAIPIPPELPQSELAELALTCVNAKKKRLALSATDPLFNPIPYHQSESLRDLVKTVELDEHYWAAVQHEAEGIAERVVFTAYGLSDDDRQAVLTETGMPPSWFAKLDSPDLVSDFPEFPQLTAEEESRVSDDARVSRSKRAARELYTSQGETNDTTEDGEGDQEDEAESETSVLPPSNIPFDSRLEQYASELGIHPSSVYSMLRAGLTNERWCNEAAAQRVVTDWLSIMICDLFAFPWPCLDRGIHAQDAVASDGIVSLIGGAQQVLDLLRNNGNPAWAELEREFSHVMHVPIQTWILDEFFNHHSRRFKKRPLIWQVRTVLSHPKNGPVFSAFIYYHELNTATLPTILSQYVRPQRHRYETEMRSIESISPSARSDRQQERLTELIELIGELKEFDEQVDQVARSGFGPDKLLTHLRQNAFDDAMLSLKAQWLQKLTGTICAGPLGSWREKAEGTKLHPSLASWIEDSMSRLRHHCSAVGPAAPIAEALKGDPTSASLASLICTKPDEMVQVALRLACSDWWVHLAQAVLAPIRAQIKTAKDELKTLKEEDYSKAKDPVKRRKEIDARTRELKETVKRWERDLNEKTAAADKLRDEISAWECPKARTWEGWLAAQPMYDAISGLDGVHQPPQSVAEWVAQESAYAPDINDGVRVNIAPLQKAGILAAEVLAAKDVDKAIADRAEWRADERRWCREGKLPKPGWWPMEKTNASGQD